VQQLCPEAEIVASDRCPNAVFSVTAELQRIPRIPRIRVKRSDLFEELMEEVGW
jgi:methylase of polypeptide subunit release factors